MGTGYGTAFDTTANRAINWAQANICKTPFRFLRKDATISVIEDTIKYLLPTDYNYMDELYLWVTNSARVVLVNTMLENITMYAVGYSTWTASIAYADGDIVVPVTPAGYQYECTTAGTSDATTEPTWPTTVGLTVSDGIGALIWTCVSSDNNKGCPCYYCESDYNSTSLARNIYIGNPHSDKSYRAALSYFQKLTDLSGDTDESLISKVYEDTPLISGALYKFAKDMDETQLAQDFFIEFKADMADMKRVLPYKHGEDFYLR
jgi:hypothetical protein